jgi:hypothetical protein
MAALSGCTMLRPIPAVIASGRDRQRSGFDHRLLWRLRFAVDAGAAPEQCVGRQLAAGSVCRRGAASPSVPNDVVVAVQGTNCTLSTINAGGISVADTTGISTITHTLAGTPGNNTTATYGAVAARSSTWGQAAAPGEAARFGQTVYSVDAATHTLRTQSLLPTVQPVTAAVSNVMNLKAQFGLDTNNDGTVDTWQPATGNWSAANLPLQPLATWQQIRAVRIAIVTRSDQYDAQVVTTGPLQMLCTT